MNPRLLLSTLLVLGTTLHLAAADKVAFRQHWEPGKIYHMETNMDMEMNAPALPGGAGNQNTTVIQQIDLVVSKDPASDKKRIEVKVSAIKAMMNMGGQLMTYDSTDPAMSQPMLQQAFGALLGKSVTLIYDKDDKYLDVLIPEGFLPTPLGQGKGPDGPELAAMLRESIDFGLPTNPIAAGEAFEFDRKIPMPSSGTAEMKMKGRFDSVVDHQGRKHAKLVMEGTLDLAAIPEEMKALLTIEPGSKSTSEVLFDLDRKVMTRNVATTEMKMSAAGRQMSSKTTVTTTIKSIEDAPKK